MPGMRDRAIVDAVTKALIETIGDAGYHVLSGADSDGNSVVEATDEKTGECFIVRGNGLYQAVCERAQQVGIDLEG